MAVLDYQGRNDEQVKVRGHRIELGEIESRLQEHSQIKEALVVAYEQAMGDQQLVAYVTTTAVAEDAAEVLSLDEIGKTLRKTLPDYMVPREFIVLDSFPLTANGKIDRKALPTPDGSGLSRQEYEAPQGELEETVATIFQELLQVEQVSRRDNFFALGGHSLLIVQLIERLRQRGLEIEVASVFTSPVVCDMAQLIGTSRVQHMKAPANLILPESEAITPEMLPLFELQGEAQGLSQDDIDQIVRFVPGGVSNIQDIYPLSPLQEGILFHHQLSEQDVYITPMLLKMDGEIEVESFLTALQKVVTRHDILRTGILWKGLSQSVQVVYREAQVEVESIVLG